MWRRLHNKLASQSTMETGIAKTCFFFINSIASGLAKNGCFILRSLFVIIVNCHCDIEKSTPSINMKNNSGTGELTGCTYNIRSYKP